MLNPTSKELRFLEELKAMYAEKKSKAREVEETYESYIEDEVYRVLPYFTISIKQMLSDAVQRENDFVVVSYKEAYQAMKASRSILENMRAFIFSTKDDEKIQERLMSKVSEYFQKLGFKVTVSSGPFGMLKSISLSGWVNEPIRPDK
jgi:predicted RNA-binding protein Jag